MSTGVGLVEWVPQRKLLSILACVPATAASIAGILYLVTGLFNPSTGVFLLLSSSSVAVLLLRVIWLSSRVGRCDLMVSDKDVSVRRGERVVESADWDQMRSVELVGGLPVWKIWIPFVSGGLELPQLIVTLNGTWAEPIVLPQLLAPLGREFRSLDKFAQLACDARGVTYVGPSR